MQLVKLRWTYIKDELTVMPLDDPARGICDIMGAKEHLIYRGDTFELANSVSSVLDVEEFSSQTVSLHVLGEDTRYSRKDLALFLPFGREKFSPLLVSSLCPPYCTFYRPNLCFPGLLGQDLPALSLRARRPLSP